MWLVREVVKEEIENCKEEQIEDWLITINYGNKTLIGETVEACIATLSDYMDLEVDHVELCGDSTDIYISDSIANKLTLLTLGERHRGSEGRKRGTGCQIA